MTSRALLFRENRVFAPETPPKIFCRFFPGKIGAFVRLYYRTKYDIILYYIKNRFFKSETIDRNSGKKRKADFFGFMKKKIATNGSTWLFIAACWVAYSFSYIGRLNFSASMADMTASGVLLKSQAGSVTTGFFICYGCGQFLSGWLGDRVTPRYLVFGGLLGASLCNLGISFAPPLWAMITLWSINGISQALLWAPIMRAVSDRVSMDKQQKTCTVLATTMAGGTLMAYILSAVLIKFFGWTAAFISGTAGPLVAAIFWILVTTKLEKEADENGIEEELPAPVEDEGESVPHDEVPQNIFKLLSVSGLLVLCIASGVQGILKDCMSTWVPTFITDVFHLESVVSILTGTMLPIVGFFGPYAANKFYIKTRDELSALFILFVISAASLSLLVLFGSRSVVIAIVALAVTYACALGQNMFTVGRIPMYFSKVGKVSLISGVMEATSYMGTACLTFITGFLVEKLGWTFMMCVWLALAVVAAVSVAFAKRRWNKFRRNLF